MRTVASECGIALGSLYNYFSSKSELLSATIEAVWKDIFQMGKTLENQMAHFLENDEKIRQGIFTENLTAEIFTDYIFTLFLSILLEKQNEKESFLEFVKNYLY